MYPLRHALPFVLFTLIACHDDSPHVYQSSPPSAPRPAVAVMPSVPEAQIGTFGAEARITSVLTVATGTPIALTEISEPIEVMTLVARGPGRPARESARVELLVRGPDNADQTLGLEAPAPTIVAHAFTVPATGGALSPGPYTIQVRIAGGDGRVLASSVPVHVTVTVPPR